MPDLSPLPPTTWRVCRLQLGHWMPISKPFPTEAQAGRYLESLPYKDWRVEIRSSTST